MRIPLLLAAGLAIAPIALADASVAPSLRSAAPPGAATPRGGLITEDSCSSPNLITGYGLFNFDNSNATTDGLDHPVCSKFGTGQTNLDVWALWTAPASGVTEFSTCGLSGLDTKLVVYRPGAVCPATDEFVIDCDDDGCGTIASNSFLTFVAVAGQKYLLRIGVYPGAAGGVGQFRLVNNNAPGVCSLNDCQDPDTPDARTSDGSNFRTAESYVAPQTGDFVGLCWWGTYVFFPDFNQDQFHVVYWTDVAGRPATPIAAFTQGSDLAVAGPIPTGRFINTIFPEYEYSACHPAVHAIKGRKYWIQITNPSGTTWYWSDGLPGDHLCLQDGSVGDSYADADPVNIDRGLCVDLKGCPVDTNGDHVIDFIDLNNILSAYGFACP